MGLTSFISRVQIAGAVINVDYKPTAKVYFIAFLHDIAQQQLIKDVCYTKQYSVQFHTQEDDLKLYNLDLHSEYGWIQALGLIHCGGEAQKLNLKWEKEV